VCHSTQHAQALQTACSSIYCCIDCTIGSLRMLRWAVRVLPGAAGTGTGVGWDPSEDEWAVALSALPREDQERVGRFTQPGDRRRAAVSALLQRAAVCAVLGVPWDAVRIDRTRGGKPFYAAGANRRDAPNWNYNVSHEVRSHGTQGTHAGVGQYDMV
jgi:hypothetical protein